MEFEIIKPIYNDIKYLFVRTKVFRERIEDESSKLSVHIGKLINAVNYLLNLDIADKMAFVNSNQSIASDVLDLNFISADNNSLYSVICSINDQLQNIGQKHKDISLFFSNESANRNKCGQFNSFDYDNKFNYLKKLIKSMILPCAMLIKSINLYSSIRYGKNSLSKYHNDMLDDLIDKAEYEEKKNLVSLHESIDTITNASQIKTAKEIKDKEFSTKEIIKGWFYFFMLVAGVSATCSFTPSFISAIGRYFIK